MYDISLPDALQARVRAELEPGERIEWLGMPRATYFTRSSTIAFLFAIPWTAFALFWTAGAASTAHHISAGMFSLFPLFGLPFILIGLAMLTTPVWTYRKALKTVYAITDKRAIIIEGGRSSTVRSYGAQQLNELVRREHSNGLGDLIFARRSWRDSDGDKHSEELGFMRISQAREVEKKLRELADSHPQQ